MSTPNPIKFLLNIYIETICFLSALLFAFKVSMVTVTSEGWFFIALSFLVMLISIFLFKNKISLPMIVYSIALVVYVTQFFDSSAEKIWGESQKYLYESLAIVGFQFIMIFIYIVVFFAIPFYVYFKKQEYIKNNKYVKLLLIPFIFFYFFYPFYFLFSTPVDKKLMDLVVNITSFVVGSLPLYWLYDLFLKRIIKQNKEK